MEGKRKVCVNTANQRKKAFIGFHHVHRQDTYLPYSWLT